MRTQFVKVGNCAAKIITTKFLSRRSQFPSRHSHEVQQALDLLGARGNHLLVRNPKTGMLFADAKEGLASLVAAVKAL